MADVTYDNSSSAFSFDVAIAGQPFLLGQNPDNPYVRETADYKAQQIDTSSEPGEQSLTGWWYRSQRSFHLGRGVNYADPSGDPNIPYRFFDSHGVDPLSDLGYLRLLKRTIKVSSLDDSNQKVIGYAVNGDDGALVVSGNQMFTVNDSNSTGLETTVSWGGSSTIRDIATNGEAYFILASDGVYQGNIPNGSGGHRSYSASASRGVIQWAKDRVIAAINNSLFELVSTSDSDSALPSAIYKHPVNGWRWTAIADGPGAIYAAGYSGELSKIYAISLDAETSKLNPPVQVGDIPRGEVILSMQIYSGFLLIGTNAGFRIGQVNSDNTVTVGPLTVQTNGNVATIYAKGSYIYFGGANSDDKVALYRLDLTKRTDDSGYFYSYHKYLFADQTFARGADIKSLTQIGQTGRLVFSVNGVGIFKEHSSEYVDSGWLETGDIRLNTTNSKIFQYITVHNQPTGTAGGGTIEVYWRDEFNKLSGPLVSYDSGTNKAGKAYGSDLNPHSSVAYRFVLKSSSTNRTTPIFKDYQVRAQPANVRQRSIKLVLQVGRVEGKATNLKTYKRDTFSRLRALEAVEELGAAVVFQDFNTGEQRYVIIDQQQFVSTDIPTDARDAQNPEGLLTVVLRTVDNEE